MRNNNPLFYLRAAVFFFLFITIQGEAQRANSWFFGSGAGLNFNTIPPSPLNGGQTVAPDNSSAISDLNGNLLFYTNGVNVWNKNHAVMPNGSGLIGHISAGQCAVIVPIPCDPNRYVIFHVTEYASPGNLSYSIVDMTLNSGLGDVVSGQKNISLGTGWTEKLCAIYNPAGNNYWLLAHKWSNNQFVAFNVNAASIATQSVVSAIGSVHNCGSYGGVHDAMGQLTISQNGSKVVNALTCADKFELFDFNLSTGILSNSLVIPGNGGNAWGTAFSPDNTKLYVNGLFGQMIYQYDISNYNATAISSSSYIVAAVPNGGYNFGYMELVPNGKLYIAKPSTNYLCVVNNPNLPGASCNFSLVGQSLGTNNSSHGTSRIAYNIPSTVTQLAIQGPTAVCSGQTATLTVGATGNYTWSNGVQSSSIVISPTTTTNYSVSGSGVCVAGNAQATVSVLQSPTITITGPASVCSTKPATLVATGANSYTWSTGIAASSVVVYPTTTTNYTVTGMSSITSCSSALVYSVSVLPPPVIGISGDLTVCRGGSTTLTATGASSYSWNTGASSSSISVSPTGNTTYTIIGTNSLTSCSASTVVNVNVISSISLSVVGNTAICHGNAATLTASGASSYTWATNSNSPVTIVSPVVTTVYIVYGSDPTGKCSGQASITVNVSECLGITNSNQDESVLSIYPNPFSENIVLELHDSGSDNVTIKVFDYTGREVYASSGQFKERTQKIDLSNLSPGVYFIAVGNPNHQTRARLIKN